MRTHLPTTRPRFLLCYGAQGAYSVALSSVSPTLAEAQKDWPMSHTAVGCFPAALALSTTVAGAGYVHAAGRWGRSGVLRTAAGAVAVSALSVAAAPTPGTALFAVAALGLSTTVVHTGVMAELASHDPRGRARRLAVNGLCASLASLLGPLTVTAAALAGNWRTAWGVVALLFLTLALALRTPSGAPAAGPAVRRDALPTSCRYVCLGVAAGVAAELCLIYFAPRAAGPDSVFSSGSVLLLYYAGELCGRLTAVARLSGRPGGELPFLAGSLLLACAGFGAFWLADSPWPRLAGLVVAGAGIGNFFPVGAALAVSYAPAAADSAMSRFHALAGVAALAGPLLVGTTADRVGLSPALALVPGFLLLMAALLALGAGRRQGVRPKELVS